MQNPSQGIGGAVGEASLWRAAISGGFSAASPGALANKIATSPLIRKIVSEAIETIADMAQSAVNGYIKDGKIDVYDLLMEALLGTPFSKGAELIPVPKSSSLDSQLTQAKKQLHHDTRVAGATPRPSRAVRVEASAASVAKIEKNIVQREDLVRDVISDAGKNAYKAGIREMAPIPLENSQPQSLSEENVVSGNAGEGTPPSTRNSYIEF